MKNRYKRYTTADDATIRKYAGKKTGEEIGIIIGRSRYSVMNRMGFLGVSGRLLGEDHAASKLSNLQVEMLRCLITGGFTACEVHKAMLNHVSMQSVYQTLKGARGLVNE